MKTAVITGATSGLGRELALQAARKGIRIIGVFGSDQSSAERTVRTLSNVGVEVEFIQQDLSSAIPQAGPLAQAISKAADHDLIFFHCAAAAFVPQAFHTIRSEDFDRQLAVAANGAWNVSKLVVPPMLRRGLGTIVFILSTAIYEPVPRGFSSYLPAKFSVMGLAHGLSSDYASRGLRVVTVSPGIMDTAMTRDWPAALRNDALKVSDVAREIIAIVDRGRSLKGLEQYRIESTGPPLEIKK